MTQPGNHLNKKGKLNNTKLYMIVERFKKDAPNNCLLYTSDAADE